MAEVDSLKKVADRHLKREVPGEGTYGVVYKAIDTKTGQTMAIKKIRLGKQKEGVNFTALREIKLLKELKHPNIIELTEAFPHKGNLHLVVEFMETDRRRAKASCGGRRQAAAATVAAERGY